MIHNSLSISAREGCTTIGRRLRAHRLAENLTQEQLARRSGVSQATLKRIESSGRGSLEDVLLIAWSLGLQAHFTDLVPEPAPRSIDDIIKQNRSYARQRASARRDAAG